MYPYPREVSDDEPTMADVRGVLPGQRPPFDPTVLDEPTSEVPVIRPRSPAPESEPPAAETDVTETEVTAEIEIEVATEPDVAYEPGAEAEPAEAAAETLEDEPEAEAALVEEEPEAEAEIEIQPAAPEGPPFSEMATTAWFPGPGVEEPLPETGAVVEPVPVPEIEAVVEAEPEPAEEPGDEPAVAVAPETETVAAETAVEPEPELEAVVEAEPEAVVEFEPEPVLMETSEPETETETAAEVELQPDPEPVAMAAQRPGEVEEIPIALWADDAADRFRQEWREVQVRFIDEPEAAVAGAKSLVTDAVRELADTLLAAQDELDPYRDNDRVDTETMRVAMRRYRAFLDRVLAL